MHDETDVILLPEYEFAFHKPGAAMEQTSIFTTLDIGTAYAITQMVRKATIYDSPPNAKTIIGWLTKGAFARVLEGGEYDSKATKAIISRASSGGNFTMAELEIDAQLTDKKFQTVSGYWDEYRDCSLKIQWHDSMLRECEDWPLREQPVDHLSGDDVPFDHPALRPDQPEEEEEFGEFVQ